MRQNQVALPYHVDFNFYRSLKELNRTVMPQVFMN